MQAVERDRGIGPVRAADQARPGPPDASAAAGPGNAAAAQRFLAAAERAFEDGGFERLLLGAPRAGPRPGPPPVGVRQLGSGPSFLESGPDGGSSGTSGDQALRVSARPLQLRGQPHLCIVEQHARRDLTHNLLPAQAWPWLRARIGTAFANAHLLTRDEELQLALSRKRCFSLRRARRAPPAGDDSAVAATPAAHNRARRYPLALERPFLAELGVTDAEHRLVPAMARKWRQINRFVDIMAGAIAASPLAGRPALELLDFGAGKGYLSFALHDHLRHALGIDARMTGVELRPELVAAGNAVAQQLGLAGMRFEAGDIAGWPLRPVDLLIALHACDTATDHAIHYAVRAGAAIDCCAPCCHQQLRPQLLQPHPLRPLLRHGVHLGQEAEMLTDAIRALLLEASGYDAQVFEFVSLEHTAKNKMILAVRRATPPRPEPLLAQLDELQAFYGVREQCLRTLLRADGLLPAA